MASAKAKTAFERDAVKVDPKHYRVGMENDRVRVVRISYRGREKSVMHQHPPGIAVFLTDCHAKFTYPDGKVEDIKAKAGEYLWFGDVWEHLPENLSDKNLELGSYLRRTEILKTRRYYPPDPLSFSSSMPR